jgi:hypothetical protein
MDRSVHQADNKWHRIPQKHGDRFVPARAGGARTLPLALYRARFDVKKRSLALARNRLRQDSLARARWSEEENSVVRI